MGLSTDRLDVNSLPEAGNRFELGQVLGSGIFSNVYAAIDCESGKNVAIKIQNLNECSDNEIDINEEYRILKDLSSHPNMPDFYGAYTNNSAAELWFVMEMCEGGTVVDLVNGLLLQNKKMKEEHIGYVLRELVKSLCFLHENHVIHRDIRGSNVLLTKNGEVKLVDFGQSRELKSPEYKANTGVGSPAWMAPEVILVENKDNSGEIQYYDQKIDVWAVGITAIEMGDGKPPYLDIHPTRALFQIVRNPPPGLSKPSNWTQLFNDFIAECLEKNPDHRPCMEELLEHPFLTQVPDNVQQEVRSVMSSIVDDVTSIRKPEVRIIKNGYLKVNQKEAAKPMHLEDLAALKEVSEDTVLDELQNRHLDGLSYTFVGDVLLYVNPNRDEPLYEKKHHYRYQFKCRSDNAPHIFSVADAAYQDMLHHEQPQHILMAGETKSGKSLNYGKLIEHLVFLGEQNHVKVNDIGLKIKCAIDVIQAFGNAANKYHINSTRHVNQTQITYSSTGKISGAIFFIYQLEKWRITNPKINGQKNFHIFYDFLEAAKADHVIKQYHLEEDHRYRYLVGDGSDERFRFQPMSNVKNFNKLLTCMRDTLEFSDEQLNTTWHILAAILNLGELSVSDDEDGEIKIESVELITKIAELLKVDSKKLSWSFLNYCVVVNGTAVRRKQTISGVYESMRVFAQTLYARLFDWIVNIINLKLSFTRAIFGDTHVVYLMDTFGFECFHQNNLDQLYVNCLNEQLQYHYNQRMFAWEMQDLEEEGMDQYSMQYRNNKPIIDALMNNPDGLFYMFDDATKNNEENCEYITNALEMNPKEPYIHVASSKSFSVAHYSGTVSYQLKDVLEKNRDFLAPEVVETMRMSKDNVIKDLFANRLTKSGNLTICRDKTLLVKTKNTKISRWGAALMSEKTPIRKYNTESRGEYSQTRRMRTASAVYRSSSMEILRSLADTAEHKNGVHFVRCMRATLTDEPLGFQPEVVRQQLKALSVVETVSARQDGYSCRISFHEFIQRYKFLAFDFYENVEVTKENCRLLLIRLKMEGWLIGKSKVFLRYYNEEYLSRLYETQVKKVIKVQSMLRAFITKRKIAPQLIKQQSANKRKYSTTHEEAALVIQKHYKGYQVRNKNSSLQIENLDAKGRKRMKMVFNRWKGKSIYQIVLLDRANKLQDVVYFSLQVHLYNQHAISSLNNMNHRPVMLRNVMSTTSVNEFLGSKRCYLYKIPFQLNKIDTETDQNILMDENLTNSMDDCNWDSPLNRLPESSTAFKILKHSFAVRDQGVQVDIIQGVRFTDTEYSNKSQFDTNRMYQKKEEKPINRSVSDNKYSTKEKNNSKMTTTANKTNINKPQDKSNPVLELQSRGKQYQSDYADEDDPPYNFQAILKKTNYKRPSVEGRTIQFSSDNSNDGKTTDRAYGGRRSDSVARNEDYGYGPVADNVKRSKDFKNELNHQLSKATRTEIIPGVMLEGSSYDL
ncbi:neither inactivation nor afterpotential protein C [Rhopalosiphum maidis]|uniref:neither inactivation nor afterpotential protein C n=1 Tax=Rhopalosiphum maidis TaxID=43146 RepID=UPI000EFE31AD|nr:neither inactivation nor afterpotential protein C [Rhopalosiphum maidis]